MTSPRRLLAAMVLGLAGCASQDLTEFATTWDSWIGTTKDDRVRSLGIPTKCYAFQGGGEVCEWTVPMEGGKNETLGLTFDEHAKTCQWAYRGFYGLRESHAKCRR